MNNSEYFSIITDTINQGKEVKVIVSGSSMAPFLCQKRDYIILTRHDGYFYKGQMVFYKRDNGQYIMHRIHHIKNDALYIIGDGQFDIEGPVYKHQVIGVVNRAIRKGKEIDHSDMVWILFEKVWIRIIPIRKLLLKIYGSLKKEID